MRLDEGVIRFGHAFMFDTGSSTGEVMGHSKVSCYFISLDLCGRF